jgi:hypothetical protein
MTVLSMPAASSRIAAVCRSTWGVILLLARVGQAALAVAVCWDRRAATASRLIRVPARVGNTTSAPSGRLAV